MSDKVNPTLNPIDTVIPPTTEMFRGNQIFKAPHLAITDANASTIDSGDATTDTVLNNMRTRIAELEQVLIDLGLLKA